MPCCDCNMGQSRLQGTRAHARTHARARAHTHTHTHTHLYMACNTRCGVITSRSNIILKLCQPHCVISGWGGRESVWVTETERKGGGSSRRPNTESSQKRERDRQRQRERDSETDRHTETDRHRDRQTQRQTDRDRQTQTDRQTDRQRQRDGRREEETICSFDWSYAFTLCCSQSEEQTDKQTERNGAAIDRTNKTNGSNKSAMDRPEPVRKEHLASQQTLLSRTEC